jgi:hypothetical protein
MRLLHRLLAVAVLSLPLIAAGAIPASANNGHENDGNGAPEIDPGLLGGAVTLLAGGLLILRERRRT